MAEKSKTKEVVKPVQEKLFDPAPSPAEMRKELEDLIVCDLLGPAGGENEVLPGKNRVRDRYIAGMLAPKKTVALEPERKTKSDVQMIQEATTQAALLQQICSLRVSA